ncbi:peptide chain release factor family protein [Aspergillus chevalieri]|uniref:Prokaryotic-type class I peptide chain release factors domain-containing protein n=1 Tax=Aspergillus chevalieri TaxID=182096 RepID=A0A7R7VRX0_ASPCH|nr:uncharacterized protein ACHE_50157S [Aspergillus chevalieri]BCR88959.1 hypothetical protein ACHE_50157S [Aspergillus chevalieri]
MKAMLRGLFHNGPFRTVRVLTRLPQCQCQRWPVYNHHRLFSLSAPAHDKPLPPRLKISDADLTISYLKGTGPGGQKINKTNSAVQIIHKPTGIVVKSQATRSRSQNEKIARQLLADRVEELEKGDQSRTAIKAERAKKKKASKLKKTRRKYRELEDKEVESDEGEEHDSVSPSGDQPPPETQGR